MIDARAVEAAARAIARARGINPDMCIEGYGSVAYRGDASFKCTKYAWRQFIGDVHAAAPFLTPQIPDGWKTSVKALEYENDRLRQAMFEQRIKPGVRAVIAALHKRAEGMNHFPAKQWLNSLAFELGWRLAQDKLDVGEAIEASLQTVDWSQTRASRLSPSPATAGAHRWLTMLH